MDDELRAFRAAHASTKDAIEKCDRLTWALQLAFEDASDRRAVVREAALTARRLLPKDSLLDFLNPFPKPLEVVERWAGEQGMMKTRSDLKSFGFALVITWAVYMVLRYLVLTSWLRGNALHELILVAVLVAATYVIARPIKMRLRRMLERRVSELDENLALTLALDQIERGMVSNPAAASRLMPRLQTSLDLILDSKPTRA